MRTAALLLVLLCLGAVKPPSVARRHNAGPAAKPETVLVAMPETVLATVPDKVPRTREPAPPGTQDLTFHQQVSLAWLVARLAFAFWLVQTLLENTVGYIIRRRQRHHTAIVRLQYMLVRAFWRTGQTLEIIPSLRDTLRGNEVATMFPARFEVDDTPGIDLYNPRLSQEVRIAAAKLTAINQTLDSFEDLYREIRQGVVNGVVNPPTYRANADNLADQYGKVEEKVREARASVEDVIAHTRVLGEKDRPWPLGFLGKRFLKSANVSAEELRKEKEAMRRERESFTEEQP